MMEIQEIEVTINKQGKVEIHLKGFQGEQCITITKELEEALGNEVELRELLAEYYDKNEQNTLGDQLNLNL